MHRPALVFISPVMPSFHGGGIRMRAAHNLRALSREFDVYLLVLALYGGGEGDPDPEVKACCSGWRRVRPKRAIGWKGYVARAWTSLRWRIRGLPSEWEFQDRESAGQVQRILEKLRPDRVWLFRFYLLPWIISWLRRGGCGWLDMDECESASRSRQAALLAGHDDRAASVLRAEAEAFTVLERRYLGMFEKVIVASGEEAGRINTQLRAGAFDIWPNIVRPDRIQPCESVRSEERSEFRLFFVGSMGHQPNRDAVYFSSREVLPLLQDSLGRPCSLMVAGVGSDAYWEGVHLPYVDFLGEVGDLGACYSRADLVLVPLRTGAGTRIKILEALAYGKAVVSTSVGAEGLEVESGRHLLLADQAQDLAGACLELLKNPEKRAQLAEAGRSLVCENYSPRILEEKAAGLKKLGFSPGN